MKSILYQTVMPFFLVEEYEYVLSLIEKFEAIQKYLGYPREVVKAIPENLIDYIDYESVGRDYVYETSGEFVDQDYYIEFI